MLIPRNIQCRIIVDLLNDRLPEGYSLQELDALLCAFDEPWQSYLGPLLDSMAIPPGLDRAQFQARYARLTAEHREMVYAEAERTPHIPALGDLRLPEIEWLWEQWIPRGMLTVLGAMPAAGKSYLALDLATRLIARTTFPDGAPVGEGGPVIYVDAENVPQILNQRARAWGTDRSQLYVMGPADEQLALDFNHADDRDRLVEWAWKKSPALIVVDSLSSISARGENSVEDVRDIFSFLSRVALDFRCGLLLIHHLRKPATGCPPPGCLTFHELRGSSHISAISRSIIGLHWVQTGPLPRPDDPRRLEVLKTNLCRYPPPIGVSLHPLAHDPEVAGLTYGEVPPAYRQPTKRDECVRWLRELLGQHGPLAPGQVMAMAQGAGFSRATVYRARQQLGQGLLETRGARPADLRWAITAGE